MPRQYTISELAELLKRVDPVRLGGMSDQEIVQQAIAANPGLQSRVAPDFPDRPAPREQELSRLSERVSNAVAQADPWRVVGRFYGLREQPFGVTPDPKFLYLSNSHREALASLQYSLHANRGFLALIAPPGTGKTTLLFEFLGQLGGVAQTAFLFKTQCDSRELIRHLLSELGVANPSHDVVTMHEQLNDLLVREAGAGRKVVAVIDEAQNLSTEVLETVRLLSDFETPTTKLIQIVLSGQPQLAQRLAQPNLVQLRQRISLWRRLDSLKHTEVHGYIEHRLKVAGYEGRLIFDVAARNLIAEESKGIPRNINNLCFNALSVGCALRRKIIDVEVIREVIADLSLDQFFDGSELAPVAAPMSQTQASEDLPDAVVGQERRRGDRRRATNLRVSAWRLGQGTQGVERRSKRDRRKSDLQGQGASGQPANAGARGSATGEVPASREILDSGSKAVFPAKPALPITSGHSAAPEPPVVRDLSSKKPDERIRITRPFELYSSPKPGVESSRAVGDHPQDREKITKVGLP